MTGKLDGKNPKQLKATFRCALNSKKELKEHSRDRERRYWQFVGKSSNFSKKKKISLNIFNFHKSAKKKKYCV